MQNTSKKLKASTEEIKIEEILLYDEPAIY